MGLFDRFFGKGRADFRDRIWLTTAGKIADLVTQVRASHERGVYPVTVVHFSATQKFLLDGFAKNEVSFEVYASSVQFPTQFTDELPRQAATLVLLSGAIPVLRSELARPKDMTLNPVSIHLAEHYPLYIRDQQVLGLDRAWPMQMEFICYTALDEPWLEPFGVKSLRPIMGRLGMDEKTMISHPLVDRSIRNAQRSISRQVHHEQSCDSCDEWMRANLPRRA